MAPNQPQYRAMDTGRSPMSLRGKIAALGSYTSPTAAFLSRETAA